MEYGYCRVSSRDQNEARQIITLKEHGVKDKNIIIDKQSGKDFEREGYKRLIRRMKAGDVLFVGSIDRLGRNYSEILEQWRIITKEKGCDIVIIDMPLLDTRNRKDLTGTLIADIVLQLMSYVAERERSASKARQADGIAAAKARGVKFGRPRKVIPDDFAEIAAGYKSKNISLDDAVALCGMSRSCFYKYMKEYGA